jgi:hypothetical protein
MPTRFARAVLIACLAVGTGGLWGCASTPAVVPVNHQRIVPLASADVWKRVHQFLADEGISVSSEDMAAGIIDAERSASGKGTLTGLATCGSQPLPFQPLRKQTLKLTVLVKPVSDGAQVTANAAFTETLASRHTGALTVACPSTGVLEAAVLSVASGQPMEAAIIPR